MNRLLCIILVILCFSGLSTAQKEGGVTKNITTKGQQVIETKPMPIVFRVEYDYQIVLFRSEDGIGAKIISNDQRTLLKKGNKMMLVNISGEKKIFDFSQEEESDEVNQRLVYTNALKMDIDGMEWLANNIIKQIRFVDMAEHKMYPYSLETDRQAELQTLARDFLRGVDLSVERR